MDEQREYEKKDQMYIVVSIICLLIAIDNYVNYGFIFTLLGIIFTTEFASNVKILF